MFKPNIRKNISQYLIKSGEFKDQSYRDTSAIGKLFYDINNKLKLNLEWDLNFDDDGEVFVTGYFKIGEQSFTIIMDWDFPIPLGGTETEDIEQFIQTIEEQEGKYWILTNYFNSLHN
jgi:hypothetical protein